MYLTGGHAGAWEGRETERRRDARRILHHAQALSETQGRLLFLTLIGLVGLRGSRPGLDDALVLQAVRALRQTVETRERGVLYEHQAEDARAQSLVLELRALFDAKDEEGRSVAPADRDLLGALQALEAGLDASLREQGGTAFLDSAARVVGRVQRAPAAPPRRPLIIEP